jgi:hypothetical protein
MQTRHRIPSVFNVSMVDVLCCCLGVVIFLWLLNSRNARDLSHKASGTRTELALTRDSLAKLKKENNDLAGVIGSLKTRIAKTELARIELTAEQVALLKTIADLKILGERDKDKLRKTTLQLKDVKNALANLKVLKTDLEKRLNEKVLEQLALARKVTATTRRMDELARQLGKSEALVKNLRAEADLVPGLRGEVKAYRDKLARADAKVRDLERDLGERKKELLTAERTLDEARRKLLRELEDARGSLADLRRDKKSLTNQVARTRAAADNRFAGIALTGKRVVFLVDMSGSMELVDEKTLAPDKWEGVRTTLAKIMKSLPDLEKYQVILFSDKVRYLFGNGGRWLDYDSRTSEAKVTRAMAEIKPTGGTNMYAAFQAAFRLRNSGLDTIYVLSDGLPNMGEGLTEENAARLGENEKAEVLSKHIRKKLKTLWNRTRAGKRVRINTIGFFYESPDVGAFLWALARENEGSFVGMSKP